MNMSGYPPSDPSLVSQYPVGNHPPTSTGYSYPNHAPYLDLRPGAINPTAGYPPTSPSFPTASPVPAGFLTPNQGAYSNPQQGVVNAGYAGQGQPTSPVYLSPGAAVPTPAFNPEVCPSAPDIKDMEKIPGYEGVTFKEAFVIPPSVPEWEPDYNERREMQNLPSLTEEEVREAAVEYANDKCCYGSDAAENMTITNISMMSAFHYTFETFSEKRQTAWRFVPYTGQLIDGPMNGPAPHAWNITVTPRYLFKDGKRKVEVPHTAFVKPCHKCVGNTRIRCEACAGNGTYRCNRCKGRGRKHREICSYCNGAGMNRCNHCCGHGQITCKICSGKGQLKCFVELTVTWITHKDEYISETSSLPKEFIRDVTGRLALEEEFPRVNPIMNTQDDSLRKVSNEFVRRHGTGFRNEQILKQRHTVRLVPIGEVNYLWNSKAGLYYVYGYERKVYFIDYPQQCCTII